MCNTIEGLKLQKLEDDLYKRPMRLDILLHNSSRYIVTYDKLQHHKKVHCKKDPRLTLQIIWSRYPHVCVISVPE